MNRRGFLGAGAALIAAGANGQPADNRPNILWITFEDYSPRLGCYGDPAAATPAIDSFAKEGVRFLRAFASAPVCSAARSCLITGRYATTSGMHQHRSRPHLNGDVRPFPEHLRQAGYHTSNNAKTDYNVWNETEFIRAAWNESGRSAHWRNRPAGSPFFSVFNFEITHQSRTCAWPYERFEEMIAQHLAPKERTDPEAVSVPPYYPDTPIVRRTLARERDCARALDRSYIAPLLRQLDEDGLRENTIVFLFSDHGTGLPRGKRSLYDSGMRVPLIVRAPDRWAHLLPAKPGESANQLVSFVDFAPTMLRLAGVDVPASYDGVPFLGPAATPARKRVFGHRDRIDEAFDFSRSVRDERWLYIRNYHPHVPLSQPEFYSKDEEIRAELSKEKSAFNSERPPEELYDTVADPHQVSNLASAQPRELARLRSELAEWMRSNRDLGFVPEEELFAGTGKYSHRAFEVAQKIKMPGDLEKQLDDLEHPDASVRFWAVVCLRTRISEAAFAKKALLSRLSDEAACVRLEAASTLIAMGVDPEPEILPVLAQELENKNLVARARAARILWSMGRRARPSRTSIEKALASIPEMPAQDPNEGPYLFAIRQSLLASLEAMG
jgi:N-sulfoglucosamine sulfohydrolase